MNQQLKLLAGQRLTCISASIYVHAYFSVHSALCFYLRIDNALAVTPTALFLLLALLISREKTEQDPTQKITQIMKQTRSESGGRIISAYRKIKCQKTPKMLFRLLFCYLKKDLKQQHDRDCSSEEDIVIFGKR